MAAHLESVWRAGQSRGQRSREAGIAAALLLVILVMGSLYVLVSGINAAPMQLEQKRDDLTAAALKQAKEALIAWSATHATGPGHLLCPDADNDGQADTVACGLANTRVGRLPWQTLGLPDLRDASGERRWYAVSRCFLERSPDGFCGNYAVNSDTQGQLRVSGAVQANGVVAIIFAPGPAIAAQTRTPANVNNVTHYLEGENANAPATAFEDMMTSTDLFETRRRCLQTDCPGGYAFNDQLVLITHQELFEAVENVVAKRIENEVAPAINAYYAAWGNTYPYAAPFDARPATPLAGGTWNQLEGLLPIDAPASWVQWESCNPTSVSPLGVGVSPSPAGTPSSGQACTLTFTYSKPFPPPPQIRFTLDTRDTGFPSRGFIGRGFFGYYDETNKLVRVDRDNAGVPLVTWITSPPGTYNGVTSATTDSNGRGHVEYRITAPTLSGTLTVQVGPPVVSSAIGAATTGALEWFFGNDWHRLTFYAIPAGAAAGQPGCVASPPCLTVNAPGGASAQARAVLVLAGRALPSQNPARNTLAPPADFAYLGNFFEGDNNEQAAGPLTAGTFARQLRSLTFNDRVVAIAP